MELLTSKPFSAMHCRAAAAAVALAFLPQLRRDSLLNIMAASVLITSKYPTEGEAKGFGQEPHKSHSQQPQQNVT